MTATFGYGARQIFSEQSSAETAQIRSKHGVARVGEPRHDQTPLPPVLRKPVQQHERRAASSGDVVDAYVTADGDNVVCESSAEGQIIRWLTAEGAIK